MRLIDADALDFSFDRRVFGEADENYIRGADDAIGIVMAASTIDPVHAAGACYCWECCFGRKPNSADMQAEYVYCQQQSKYKAIDAFCADGEPKEARDDD